MYSTNQTYYEFATYLYKDAKSVVCMNPDYYRNLSDIDSSKKHFEWWIRITLWDRLVNTQDFGPHDMVS